MSKGINKLSTLAVGRLKKDGIYADGGNLYLQVRGGGEYKSWLFRYMRHGNAHDVGLGPLHTFTLADARAKAQKYRALLKDGVDLLAAKRAQELTAKIEAQGPTFEEDAEAYIKAHEAGWKQARHGDQWRQSLTKHAYAKLGKRPVRQVDTNLVLAVLEPIWKEKTETAKRLRGRIESILDWSKTKGHREGENPARWRGHLDNMLASPNKLIKVEHMAALPYREVCNFLKALRHQDGEGSKALQLVIYTVCRSTEVLAAQWDEIDLAKSIWTIPGERMKTGASHEVPLTKPALDILTEMKVDREANTPDGAKPNPYLFPSPQKAKGTVSNAIMLALLKRMKRRDITVHGFRSSFRDWAAEQTDFPREIAEACLAHTVADKVEAAYLRTKFFDKRRNLMTLWATHCQTAVQK